MNCAIIGAGIGGLTTAMALKQKGFDVKIYEAAPEIKPLGAGIVMATNAMLVFQRLGLAEKIKAAGYLIKEGFICDQRWKPIQRMNVDYVSSRYGVGSYAYHRADLHKVLLDQLPAGTVALNHKLITARQEKENIHLGFENGFDGQFDCVIGADGIKSVLREAVFGKSVFRYSGQTCWRSIVEMDVPAKFQNITYELWGSKAGLRFGIVAVDKNRIYFFATEKSKAGGEDKQESLKQNLVSKFEEFGADVVSIIQQADVQKIIRTDIYDLAPIKKWHDGNVVLLGDAAHATTPNLGQGGCQAVEDAYVIAEAMSKNKNFSDAFRTYQNIRFAKANYVVNTSWQLGRLTNMPRPFIGLRNFTLRLTPPALGRKTVDALFTLNY